MREKLKLLLENPPPSKIPFWENTRAKIFIYGAGSMALSIHRVLAERGVVLSGFLDHRIPEKPLLNGLPIFAPDQALDAIVVIGIHNRDAEIPSIVEQLRSSGAVRVITPVELYDFFSHELGIRYWLTERAYYFSFKSVIEETSSIWTDEASQSLYAAILDFRITGDYSILPPPDLDHQYFPLDIPAWKTPLRFVDCGAFDGDTLVNFQKSNIPLEAVAAFEPDEINFRKLTQYVSTEKQYFSIASLWPCGVSSSTHQLSFDTGRGEASAVSPVGGSVIQCVSLDEAIPNFAPNLIKMDIEGAELEALLGARNLINTSRPGLAISVYHHPAHLWQIPLLIENIAKSRYQYYLRVHAFNDFDVVLYAIPN